MLKIIGNLLEAVVTLTVAAVAGIFNLVTISVGLIAFLALFVPFCLLLMLFM